MNNNPTCTLISVLRKHKPQSFHADVTISGVDKFLIPGLNDMHVHFRGGEKSVDENRDLLPLYSESAFWFALDAANAHGLKSISHLPNTVSTVVAAERGLDLIAHSRAIVRDGASGSSDIRARLIGGTITSAEAVAEFAAGFDQTTMLEAIQRLAKTDTAVVTTYYGDWIMAAGLTNDIIDWEREQYRYVGPIFRESTDNLWAGSIEEGRVANLVLLEANPLIDISNTTRISGVTKTGRFLSRTELDAMLLALESKYANY